MFPVVVATATWNGNLNAIQAQMPNVVINSGDLILVFEHRSGGTVVGTLEAGWTDLVNDTGGTNCGTRVAYRVAAGTEQNTTIQLAHFASGSDNVGTTTVIVRNWSGIAGGTVAWAAASTTQNPPALTSGFGPADVIWFAFYMWNNLNAVPPTSSPSGYGNEVNVTRTGIGDALFRKSATLASDDPAVLTAGSAVSANGGALTVAVLGKKVRPIAAHDLGAVRL